MRIINLATALPVVFLFGGILANMALRLEPHELSAIGAGRGLGGPVSAEENIEIASYLVSEGSPEATAVSDEDFGGFVVDTEAALMSPNHPLRDLLPSREGTITYKVEKGDTLSGIADKFGISMDTILSANDKVRERIQVGQLLIILPVSGVVHTIEEGQTLDSIARTYGVDVNKIMSANSRLVEQNRISAGGDIIIPGAKKRTATIATLASRSLPNLAGYFGLPAAGWNWGKIHAKNAVDIANACGTPIRSMAEGLITTIGSPSQWNGGYGGFIDIDHPNKTGTKYAHIQKALVQVGDYVTKGQIIAEMGNTGHVHGASGCHLHLEVEGAANPLAKR